MHITALHAGLECGLLSDLSPSLDILSIGPDITSPHSPAETLHLPSIALIWHLLEKLLANLE
jgi:dipeptidase D